MQFLKGLLSATLVIGTLILIQCPATVYGSGFGIFTQGASALGQADSVVAHTDGPSTIFFNPALLNQLPGTQIEIGTTLLFPSRQFTSAATGATATTEDTFYFPSTLYVSHKFNDSISAGLGIFNPFGLGTVWNNNWEGRYIATESQIDTYDFNPVVSYQITPDLSFAAGLDVVLLYATLENEVSLATLGLPDANQKFTGNGTGVGYNLGAAYNVGHGVSLGISYRSEVDINVKGNVNFGIPAAPAPYNTILAATFPNTGGNTSITLPRQIMAGVAYKANDKLTLETGFRWEDWHSFNQLTVNLNQAVAGQTSVTTPEDWHDSFAINIGGKYRLNDNFALMTGYLFSWNPVPDGTFNPSIPDSNTHLFCVGSEAKFDKLTFAVSYAYQLQADRTKNNIVGGGAANGTYHSDIQLVGLSAGYRF